MIEQKLEELTAALQELTEVVKGQAVAGAAPAAEAKPEPKKETAKKAPAKGKAAAKKAEPKPEPEQTEPANDVPDEDWGDDAAEDFGDEPMGLDEFRRVVMKLGPSEGPKFLAAYDAKRISDVPEEDRRQVAADAQKILGD